MKNGVPKKTHSSDVKLDNIASILNNIEIIEGSFQQNTNITNQVSTKPSNTAYNKSAQALQKRAGKMFNNPKCSDTVFLVNESKFFASSHLLIMASDVFDKLINTQYENCGDREIKIRNIKNDNSFSVLLQYIYAIEMDFAEMNTGVLCEVVSLCKTYGLEEFGSDLKCYLSQLEHFEMETIVVLLNMAQQFNLKPLYKKLLVFAFQNADDIVHHGSFVDLQYAVLVDLLKSDWFCAPEMDILQGVLHWHVDKKVTSSKPKIYSFSELLEDNDSLETKGSDPVEVSDQVEPVCDKQSADTNLFQSPLNEMTVAKNEDLNKTLILDENNESQEVNTPHPIEHTVQTFTTNVLKSILSYIRLTQIPTLDFLKASNTEPFLSYKQFLYEYQLFSQTRCPRKSYQPSGGGACSEKLCCPVLVRQFTVTSLLVFEKMHESAEECLIEKAKWKLCLKLCKEKEKYCYRMFVKVTFEPPGTGASSSSCSGALCQLRLLSHQADSKYPSLILPAPGVYKEVIFNSSSDAGGPSAGGGAFSASVAASSAGVDASNAGVGASNTDLCASSVGGAASNGGMFALNTVSTNVGGAASSAGVVPFTFGKTALNAGVGASNTDLGASSVGGAASSACFINLTFGKTASNAAVGASNTDFGASSVGGAASSGLKASSAGLGNFTFGKTASNAAVGASNADLGASSVGGAASNVGTSALNTFFASNVGGAATSAAFNPFTFGGTTSNVDLGASSVGGAASKAGVGASNADLGASSVGGAASKAGVGASSAVERIVEFGVFRLSSAEQGDICYINRVFELHFKTVHEHSSTPSV
ncbi:hypothetical protein WDU94_006335 [Cyamophila willieti]